ncbi:penicillin acylase family protein [Dyadobacter alkalitolerans]|uniref:penicillin acylase family protein n=1 Tax=Dyadobacter alkalitolerans TaxID=492736 RepID=UPI000401069A|nr:penicillin acylase family protein [Dyadobacter alkalitolerans]
MKRIITIFFLTLNTIVNAQPASKREHPGNGTNAEILWDNDGVPHIYGQSLEAMYYGFGYAQMANHADLLLRLYGQARGRAAEYWGPAFLDSDKIVTLFGVPERAKTHYAQQDVTYRRYLEAFVNGLNAYAKANPQSIGNEFAQVLPVTGTDVLAHISRVICLEFLGAGEAGRAQVSPPGSNAYAIAPSKSASKKAMLVANPHLPWDGLFLFFEAHLNGPDFMAYGASLVGQPVLNIAFNNNLGWTHTVNTIDAADRYALTLKDDGYMLDGIKQAFETKHILLKVRQPDGSLKEQAITCRYSKHGPVMNSKDGKTYAMRFAGLDNAGLAAQHHAMAAARDWKEFETALKQMQLPMFNVIYADKAGNIFYLFAGSIPKRSEGDWLFWQGAIDGSSSKLIWTQTHGYDDLPKLFNPPTGFVQNANDVPWSCTYPALIDPARYASYMSPIGLPLRLRPQRSINLIKDDAAITFDELINYKMNTGLEAADRFLDDLLKAVDQHPDSLTAAAGRVLSSWDRTTNADSKGAVLFTAWFDQFNPGMAATGWDPKQPVSTPRGLKNPKQAVELLGKAAKKVQEKYRRLDVAWGEVNRFGPDDKNYPANGGSEQYGIYRTIYFTPDRQQPARNRATSGDTYVAVTEFGAKVRAQVSLSYGNATQPGHKHNGDQWEDMSAKRLRPALLERKDILKNLEHRQQVNMNRPESQK